MSRWSQYRIRRGVSAGSSSHNWGTATRFPLAVITGALLEIMGKATKPAEPGRLQFELVDTHVELGRMYDQIVWAHLLIAVHFLKELWDSHGRTFSTLFEILSDAFTDQGFYTVAHRTREGRGIYGLGRLSEQGMFLPEAPRRRKDKVDERFAVSRWHGRFASCPMVHMTAIDPKMHSDAVL